MTTENEPEISRVTGRGEKLGAWEVQSRGFSRAKMRPVKHNVSEGTTKTGRIPKTSSVQKSDRFFSKKLTTDI